MLKVCEQFLLDSRSLRDIAALKSIGITKTGRINPAASTKQLLKKDWKERKQFKANRFKERSKRDNSETKGIESSEIERQKVVGKYYRCACPSIGKGSHKVKDCIRPIKLDKGTASHPKDKSYQQPKTTK